MTENRHQPNTIYAKTCIFDRYKITVYGQYDWGELWDLQEDPKELNNLWDSAEHQALKHQLMHQFLQAEMMKEPVPMPRVSGA